MLQKTFVIIVHFGELDFTFKAIESCLVQTADNIDIIVVNNGLNKDRESLEQRYASDRRVKVIDAYHNTGFAEGNNIGVKESLKDDQSFYILFLNNDAILEKNAAKILINAILEKNADIAIPKILKPSRKVDSLGLRINKFYHPFNRIDFKDELFGPTGACFLITREAVEKLGNMFREDFFAYAEDYELGWRIKKMGFKNIMVETAIVHHAGQGATCYLSDFTIYHTYRNLIWTHRIHLNLARYLISIIGLIPYLCFYVITGRLLILKSIKIGLSGKLK